PIFRRSRRGYGPVCSRAEPETGRMDPDRRLVAGRQTAHAGSRPEVRRKPMHHGRTPAAVQIEGKSYGTSPGTELRLVFGSTRSGIQLCCFFFENPYDPHYRGSVL